MTHRYSFVLVAVLVLASACDDSTTSTPDTTDDAAGDIAEDVAVDPIDDVDADAESDLENDSGIDVAPDADLSFDVIPDVSVDHTACYEGGSAQMTTTEGASFEYEISSIVSYKLDIPLDAVGTDRTVSFGCVEDEIVPNDHLALSEAVDIDFTGRLLDYATVVIPFDRTLFPDEASPGEIRLFLSPAGGSRVVSPPVVDLQENMTRGFVTFKTRDAGIYQVAIGDDTGEVFDREWQFRAISGVSMGCGGATMIGIRNPEAFDIIGGLGGPTSWTYLMHYIREGGLGGFTPAPTFGSADAFTPTEEFEHAMTYDNFWSPTGEGSGGSFDRGEYLRLFQDLAYAIGNTGNYSETSPWLPPGVPLSEISRTDGARCPGSSESVLTIATGFYDDEYNPDGSRPVIMFCDATANQDRTIEFDRYCDLDENGTPDEPNRGLYPGADDQHRAVTIGWAVDVNGNSRRDFGEPVIRNYYEPFKDVGSDGLADADEAGYDAVTNPDPAEDNYDYFNNPTGTERNWLYDVGEPYQDVGLDGVAGTPQLAAGGYDFGEGNLTFDYNPHLGALYTERDPHHLVQTLSADEWDHLTIYMDGGIRDLFNFAVGANHLVGQMQAQGENVRVYDGFHALSNLDPEVDSYLFTEVDYNNLGDHVYLRYGNPDASWDDVCWGDGKHVGDVPQITNRLLTLLGFITNRFPDGDYTTLIPPYATPNGHYHFYSDELGAIDEYSVVLPPGHERTHCTDNRDNDDDGLVDGRDGGCSDGMDNSEGSGSGAAYCSDGIDNDLDGLIDFPADGDCADGDDYSEWPNDHPLRDATFPVIYLMHGYGMTPDDLRATVALLAGYMAGGYWQKAIVVYPDGYCGDNFQLQCNDGIDNDGDELIDLADPDCQAVGGRGEDGVSHQRCDDGVDNDGDGLIDLADGGCVTADGDDESDCVKGTFFTDHVAWPNGSTPGPAFEGAFMDLVEHIDTAYRVRAPETHDEVR